LPLPLDVLQLQPAVIPAAPASPRSSALLLLLLRARLLLNRKPQGCLNPFLSWSSPERGATGRVAGRGRFAGGGPEHGGKAGTFIVPHAASRGESAVLPRPGPAENQFFARLSKRIFAN